MCLVLATLKKETENTIFLTKNGLKNHTLILALDERCLVHSHRLPGSHTPSARVCLSKVERSKGKIKRSEIEWKVADLRGGKASAGAGTRCDDAAPRHTHRTK
jgi:hypothetical protein